MRVIISLFKKIKARLVVQIAALLGFNAAIFNAALQCKNICAPVFNCHSCPAAVFACPIGVLVNFSMLHLVPLVAIGVLGLVGVMGGRIVCGWVCPFGLLQDLLHKIPTRKRSLPSWMLNVKFLVLAGMVVIVPYFLPQSLWVFCRLCPAATLESSLPRRIMALEGPFAWDWASISQLPTRIVMPAGMAWDWSIASTFLMRFDVLLLIILLAIFISRFFCRAFCPLGAIFSLFNRFSLFRMKLTYKCNYCGICEKRCPMEIHPVDQINSIECIRCMECNRIKHFKLGAK